jgi:DNA helicase-2/ATP-dependent DNA helicase PcrA
MINKTLESEKEYLEQVLTMLRNNLQKSGINLSAYSKDIQDTKEYIWENIYDLDPEEIASMNEIVKGATLYGETMISQNKKLRKLLSSPYFGRIDFTKKTDKNNIPVYIGLYNFSEDTQKGNIIYDWRAPISSMFYDFELGKVYFEAPAGKVEGEITLKRQYRINNGRMEFMLENSLTIGDNILLQELKNASDEKMKGIVSTIQREQNQIIRNESAKVLIIQGVAGSGKSSIALHRAAFLLYKQRERLTSRNILIISPNKVFADYISNVLPELGEERILEISFEDIAKHELKNICRFQTFYEQVDDLIERNDGKLKERIKLKSSYKIIHLLRTYISQINQNSFKPKAINFPTFSITATYLIQKYYSYSSRLSEEDKLLELQNDVLREIQYEHRCKLLTDDIKRVRSEIKVMFNQADVFTLYENFYKSINQPELFCKLSSNKIEYADVFPLIYLKLLVEGIQEFSYVKHLIVDEMQDYAPIQYEIISKLFKCNKTILGDVSQSVNPYSNSSKEIIAKIFPDALCLNLFKSYRSTLEITTFSQKISQNKNLIPVERHGKPVDVFRYENSAEQIENIVEIINNITKSEYKSVGVICKTQKQAEEFYTIFKQHYHNIYLLNSESSVFINGIVVTSIQMSKGLEFDAVVVPDVSVSNYKTEMDRNLLYIACTRAMHKLVICYIKKKSILIEWQKDRFD